MQSEAVGLTAGIQMTKWRNAAIVLVAVLLIYGCFTLKAAWKQHTRALVLEEYKHAGWMERETDRHRYVTLKVRWRDRQNFNTPDLKSVAIDGRHYQASSISALRLFPELESVDLDWTAISDISPLANCRALEHVSLRYTRVRDFRVFTRFPRLKTVAASGCNVERIAFANANQVNRLDLKDARIPDMSFLSFLQSLTHLDLDNTTGDDYSVIGSCRRLQCLSLNGAKPGTTNFLGKLTRLETLHLRRAAVAELSSIQDLADLKVLDILGTHTDKGFLRQLGKLEDLHVTWKGNGDDLSEIVATRNLRQLEMEISPEFQLEKLAIFKNLKMLKLSGQINDIQSLALLPELELLDLSATQVSNVTSLAQFPKLRELMLNSPVFNHKRPSKESLGLPRLSYVWILTPNEFQDGP